VLAELASPPWRYLEGTAEGFGLTGIPFEALDNGEQRVTLWTVARETWITAALRPGWDATRQLPADANLPAIIAALLAGELERSPLAAPKPSLFAGLLGRTPAEPVTGAQITVAGIVLDEWPRASGGGVFTAVSPTRGTGS
jgi:hypothetical protein